MTLHGRPPVPLSSRRPTPAALWRVALVWGLLVMASFIAIAIYAKTPGRQAPPKPDVGELSGSRAGGVWRIAMAIHPRCPCSKASITHLRQLLERCEETLAVDVYVYRPPTLTLEWAQTSIVELVQRLPSVAVHDDVDGDAAREFGIETSGGLVLYSPEGVAVFYGGITPSRGHQGANDGMAALEDSIAGRPIALRSHPVYGCPLGNSGGAS